MENFYYLRRVDRECMADNEAVIVRSVHVDMLMCIMREICWLVRNTKSAEVE